METISTWVLSVLMAIAPYKPDGHGRRYQPDASAEEHAARMASIAKDFAEVVGNEAPLPGMTRADTLRLMLSTANYESGFEHDVDFGVRHGVGDSGRSFCLMQINVGRGKVRSTNPEIASWTGRDLVEDRQKCLRAGLDALRRSMVSCKSQGLSGGALLSSYISGKCSKNDPQSLGRWSFARGKLLGQKIDESAWEAK